MTFPRSKESACNMGDLGSIPRLGRSPGEGNSHPLQYSYLENSMDRGTWWAPIHGVTKSWTRLTNTQNTPTPTGCTPQSPQTSALMHFMITMSSAYHIPARHRAKHFKYKISFNPHNNLRKYMLCYCPHNTVEKTDV